MMKEGTRLFNLVNYGLLQTAWFACVLGSANDAVWIGWIGACAFIALHFALVTDRRADAILSLVAIAFGAVCEVVNRTSGAVAVAHDPVPYPYPPSWLMLLWIALAISIRHSMGWMRGRPVVAAIVGGIAGPLGLQGGARLGGVTLSSDPRLAWGLLIAEWVIVMPLLVVVADRVTSTRAPSRPAPRNPESRPS